MHYSVPMSYSVQYTQPGASAVPRGLAYDHSVNKNRNYNFIKKIYPYFESALTMNTMLL